MRNILLFSLIVGGFTYIIRAGIEFLSPEYWDPKTLIDYSAVFLSTFQDLFFALVLFTMSRLAQPLIKINEKIWGLGIMLAALGILISGIGNLLEDFFQLSLIGGAMFNFGGLGGAISLMITFVFSLTISDMRVRWSWFYILPIISAIFLSNFAGFIIGFAMLYLYKKEGE